MLDLVDDGWYHLMEGFLNLVELHDHACGLSGHLEDVTFAEVSCGRSLFLDV